jgi:hypothetical protein
MTGTSTGFRTSGLVFLLFLFSVSNVEIIYFIISILIDTHRRNNTQSSAASNLLMAKEEKGENFHQSKGMIMSVLYGV